MQIEVVAVYAANNTAQWERLAPIRWNFHSSAGQMYAKREGRCVHFELQSPFEVLIMHGGRMDRGCWKEAR